MRYGSVCSGIEAATVAWHPLGWEPAWFSEIEKFPGEVLKYHYPKVPNLGDMTKLEAFNIYKDEPIDLLVGGTPCQSFSIAGLRKGLGDVRGNLALEYCRILIKKQPRWFVWENVPGVFSSNGGRDLEAIVIAFRECGYSCAWRVLDAQYYGVPQRRRRVFVVGYFGNDWRPPYAVLFERESLFRDFEESAKEREKTTAQAGKDTKEASGYRMISFGEYVDDNLASPVKERDHKDATDLIIHSIDCRNNVLNHEISAPLQSKATNGGISLNKINPVCYNITFCDSNGKRKDRPNGGLYVNETDKANTLTKAPNNELLITDENPPQTIRMRGGREGGGKGALISNNLSLTLARQNDQTLIHTIARRLTPLECERLQGFPDNYTKIPGAKDSPRYAAIGNSMAVPVMNWVGRRIDMIDKILKRLNV